MSSAAVITKPTDRPSIGKILKSDGKNEKSATEKTGALTSLSDSTSNTTNDSKLPEKDQQHQSWAHIASTKHAGQKSGSAAVPMRDIAAPLQEISESKQLQSINSETWSTLPEDVLEHHLQPFLVDAASIKALRQVCKRYSNCIKLWKISMRLPGDSRAPFLPALLASVFVSLDVRKEEDFLHVVPILKRNEKIHSLRVVLYCGVGDLAIEALSSFIESAPELSSMSITTYQIPESYLPRLASALLRQKSIKSLEICLRTYLGGAYALFKSMISQNMTFLNIQGLLPIDSDCAKLLADWFSSPSCALQQLAIQSLPNSDISLILMNGLKLNRSLRSLSIWQLSVPEIQFYDCIAQQGHIETLSYELDGHCHLEAFVKMLVSCKNLKTLSTDFGFDDQPVSAETVEHFKTYLASNYGISNSTGLFKLIWSLGRTDSMLQALSQNRSIVRLRANMETSSNDTEFFTSVITNNHRLKQVSVLSLDQCRIFHLSAFAAAFKRNRGIEELTLDQFRMGSGFGNEWMQTFFSAIKSLPNLRKLSVHRFPIDSVVSQIAKIVSKSKNLQLLSFYGCSMSEKTLERILTAAATLRTLETLDLNGIEFSQRSTSRDGLNRAFELTLQNNRLRKLDLVSTQLDASTINAILSFLKTTETCYLQTLDLRSVRMADIVKKNFKNVADSKSGLFRVTFEM